jgi:glycerol-3-phosphate dehydrogenase
VDAGGPWAGDIAAMARIRVPIVPTAGVMVVLDGRLNNMVISRLNKPSDGDIVVSQRATSIIGTTSWQVKDPDLVQIPQEHVDRMLTAGAALIPGVRRIPVRATMAAARPLIAQAVTDGRELSRTFSCYDHAADNVAGLITIAGGKTTTSRAMAERAADVVCAKLGITAPCRTREVRLTPYACSTDEDCHGHPRDPAPGVPLQGRAAAALRLVPRSGRGHGQRPGRHRHRLG